MSMEDNWGRRGDAIVLTAALQLGNGARSDAQAGRGEKGICQDLRPVAQQTTIHVNRETRRRKSMALWCATLAR